MISFFRRAMSSWLVLGLLALVMIAFIITGVNGPGTADGSASGARIATIGKDDLYTSEAARRVQTALNAARQQNPALDIADFVASGGVEQVIGQYISARAMELWAADQGIGASDKLVDGEIASIPAFAGPTGTFDRETMLALIGRQNITEQQLRADIAGDSIRRQLLIPIAGATNAPKGIVTPYASLLLERRSGMIGLVPSDAMPQGEPPTDAEIAAHYRQNIARYTVPERRALRYALFGAEKLKTPVAPSDAEIAAFYNANAATYGARETRMVSQLVLPDQNAAAAFAARIKGGADFVAAARQTGLAPTTAELDRDALADQASPAVAAAAFATPESGVIGPIKADLGWYVLKVGAVKTVAGRPLAAVRAEIAAGLEKQKADEALANMVTAIEDAIADGSSFDDVARSEKLTVVTTPPLLPNGAAPGQPDWQPAPELGVLLKTAFEMGADEDPTVETIGNGQRYALLAVTQVVPAVPAPLAEVRNAVAADIVARRAVERSRAAAEAIVAKAKAGTPLPQAFASAGVPLRAPEAVAARQMDLARSDRPVPRPLALMFAMKRGDTKLLAAEGNGGWYVVKLDTVVPGDAASQPGLIEATRGEFTRVLGQEYAEQFANAIAQELGVTRNPKAIQQLKAQLAGGAAGQ